MGVSVNCRQCRAGMCTDGLLSELRCAECRQIEFERFCSVALKAGLILSVTCLAVSLLTRRADLPEPTPLTDGIHVDRHAA
jgi:hypothetical protein